MIKKKIKNITTWLIVTLASTTLILTSLNINPSKNKNDNDHIKIDNYIITKNEINILVNKILEKKNIVNKNKKIIEKKIHKSIIKNIKYNINQKKNKIITSQNEIKDTITTNKNFQINDTFSINLYKSFLKSKKYTDLEFQKEIRLNSIKTQIKNCILLANKNKSKIKRIKSIEYKIKAINSKQNEISDKKILKFYNKNINKFKSKKNINLKYIFVSTKNIIKNIKTEENKIEKYIKKQINTYSKPALLKIKLKKKLKNSKEKNIYIKKEELNKNLQINIFNKNFSENPKKINKKNCKYKIYYIKKYNNQKYNQNKIKKDIINKYKKYKAEKIIKTNFKTQNNLELNKKSLKELTQILNTKKNTHKLISKNNISTILPYNITNTTNNINITKISNKKYIIYKISEDKDSTYTEITKNKEAISKYINQIKNEKKINNKYKNKIIQSKKNWKKIDISSKNTVNNLPKKIKLKIYKTKKNNNTKLIKIKNKIFIINIKILHNKEKLKTTSTTDKTVYEIYKKYN